MFVTSWQQIAGVVSGQQPSTAMLNVRRHMPTWIVVGE
jgi:hypothetical protein